MSLFQTSVIKKHLSDLSPELIDKKYIEFQSYFGNPERQENIRNLKEEEFQEGFIRELFVKIFGYTLNPEPNFNIVLEKKNVDDSKKSDGAIIRDNEVIAVIELKSTQTTNLDSFRDQAFNYKNHHPKCIYVITSNFEKIRLYINDTTFNEEFDLFNLTKERFELLWLCFSKDSIINDIPLKIKEASVLQEENVTKELYNDYSKFREEIFNNIVKNNPEFDKLVLFKKTQKLLDRFLFIFFAEDRLLLPPNSISEIVQQWNDLKDKYDEYFPLYERFKKYFGYLNTGFKGKKYDIFAYNGGLFLPDEILDNIKIDDDILHKHTLKLSKYDFETDVDVNILGHIFEHSLGEIENVQAEIAGEEIDTQKTKRKKDGIFYTPKYITNYIVENTVGKLCEEKRAELGIIDEEYAKGRKNRKKEIVKDLDNKLTIYREWLLNITILDPACGSGAFLNQALEFLIEEHKNIDELKAQLFGGSIVFSDIEAKILENNIYGVDLNEESVEIAKLSLWLRTAQKGRKLTTLSNHIKCGNSLIDDPVIAGEKAFNWEKEFPEVFTNGGFDIVIGNPPYVDNRGFDKIILNYLFDKYENSFQKSGTDHFKTTKLNLINPFIELNQIILKENGLASFIFHKNIFKTNGYTSIRKYLLTNYDIILLTDWGADQFKDVVAETATFVIRKGLSGNDIIKVDFFNLSTKINESTQLQSVFLDSYEYIFGIYSTAEDRKILDKMEKIKTYLGDYVNVNNGIVTGNDKKFISNSKIDDRYKKIIRGKDIKRYSVLENKEYVLYDSNLLLRARNEEIFKADEKLLMQMININFVITYDDNQYYNLGTTYALTIKNEKLDLKYILTVLNSKLIGFYYKKKFTNDSSLTNAISTQNLVNIPIIEISSSKQLNFINLANEILTKNKELFLLENKFTNLIESKLETDKLNRALLKWKDLDNKVFIKELNKYKKLSLAEESDWIDFFNSEKEKANILKSEISKLNIEIDHLVYSLYNISEKEIKLIEENS